MRVIRRGTDSVSLGPHGEEREIVSAASSEQRATGAEAGLLGLYHLRFYCRIAHHRTLRRAHPEIGVYAGMSDHFVSEAVYLTDPDGLGSKCTRIASDAWLTTSDQLYMTTNHLDVDDLVSSARRTLDGMPPVTVLGHVHLYVDDIAKAEAFYHDALGFDKVVGAIPAHSSCRPVAITIISERTRGSWRTARDGHGAVCWSGRYRPTKEDAEEAARHVQQLVIRERGEQGMGSNRSVGHEPELVPKNDATLLGVLVAAVLAACSVTGAGPMAVPM